MNIGTLLMVLEEQKRNSPAGDATEIKFVMRHRFPVVKPDAPSTPLGVISAVAPFGELLLDINPQTLGIRNDIAQIEAAENGDIRLYIE